MKNVLMWMAAALVVVAVLVIAGDPAYWLGRMGMAARGRGAHSESYSPRAVLRGTDQPPAPRQSPASEQLDVESLRAAADYAAKQQSRSLIVTRHGYIVFEQYWQGSNLDTVVDSQGLGRIVAALAAGVALSERKIGWPDEPLSYFIPQWAKDARGAITVRNLLQSSSGLGSAAPAYGTNAVSRDLELPLGAPPGTRWLDQSVDSDLLAYVIQNATGQSYADYASQGIWARIGAADASLWVDSPGGTAHVDTGFRARQGDWLRVAEVLLQAGKYQGDEIVVPRWVPELLQPAKSNSNYGSYLHLGAHPAPGMAPYATDDVFVVEGEGNRMWLIPSLQIAILRTGGRPAADWDEGRIPNLIIRGARDFVPPTARPGADLRQLVPNH